MVIYIYIYIYLYIYIYIYNIVFFIVSGRAALVLQEYRNLPFVYMEKGDSFGEGELVSEECAKTGMTAKREFTARAVDDCELIILSKMVSIYIYIYI